MQKDNNLLDLEDYNTVEVEVEEMQDAKKRMKIIRISVLSLSRRSIL